MTQQNAANAEESASAAEEMSAQAEQMHAMVGELVAVVGGADGARTPAARSRKPVTARKPAEHQRRVRKEVAIPGKSGEVKAKEIIPLDDDEFTEF